MLKLTMCVRRLPRLTRQEFDGYWLDHHGPLVRTHQDALRIRRYVQTLAMDNPAAQEALQVHRDALEFEFDGCAELWWDSLDDHVAARKTSEGVAALRDLLEDERRFVDLTHSQLWYGTERQII